MTFTFPNETEAYRAARDRLLAQEIGLRRTMEALAAARRALPPGGEVPQDSKGCARMARPATCACRSCSRPAEIPSSSTA